MVKIGIRASNVGFVAAVFLAMTMPFTGCTTSQGRPSREDAVVSQGSLMLVLVREFSFDRRIDDIKDEDRILNCVRDGILGLRPKQPIVSFDEFRRVAFPGLQRESVPRHPQYFAVLSDSAEFHESIAPLGLRYVVFLGGVVETSEPEGWGICGAGYGGGGCFAYVEWDKASRMGATVLDLRKAQAGDRIETQAFGKAWVALVGVFPIGLPSDPSAVACKKLGSQIARFLDSEEIPMKR